MSRSKVKTNGKRSTKKGLFAIGLAIAMVVGAFGLSFGNSGYYNAFGTQYGTAVTNAFGCGVCHTSPPTLNPYGNDFFNSNFNFSAIEALDSDGDGFTNIAEINAVTNPGSAASHPVVVIDTTPPVVTGFVIPSSSASLTVAVTSLTATDASGVTGYMVTTTSTVPAASAAGWSAAAPTSYVFSSAGAKTLYAWAKDAAGNVSVPVSATTTITLPDTTPPVVTGFVIPQAPPLSPLPSRASPQRTHPA